MKAIFELLLSNISINLSQKRLIFFYFITFITFLFGSYYISLNQYFWLSTDLGNVLFPVQRKSCFIPPAKDAISPIKAKNLKIGMIMIHKNLERIWGQELVAEVIKNREKYCEKYGYSLINANALIDHGRPIAWTKIIAMKHFLPQYDYLLFMDMDMIIMNHNISLNSIIAKAPNHDFIMTEDWNGLNSGVWLAKNSPFTFWFLEAAWNQTHLIPRKSVNGTKHLFNYEQRAFHYLLNTKIWNTRDLPRYPGNSTALLNHFYFTPQCSMNSYIMYPFDYRGNRELSHYVKGDFMIHFAGKAGPRRIDLMNYYLKHIPS